LNKSLKRLQTDHVDLFFIHAITGIGQMTPAFKAWAAEMKQAGKIKFFGFSTHTNMADCLAGAARLDWIDAVMMTYNFQVMHDPKMQEAVKACEKSGVGLVAMKTMGGGPGAKKTASPAKLEMAEKFLKRGFTDKQAKLKVVWETPQIASLCSQMPNLTILMPTWPRPGTRSSWPGMRWNPCASTPWRPSATTAPAAAASARRPWAGWCR